MCLRVKVILDEDFSFRKHAKSVLKRCWYDWHMLTKSTTRYRGLNTSTLLILFKTIILTKILYAAPVWLDQNFDIFKKFMSKVLLKIVGAQCFPAKMLSEVILGLPPLQLIAEQVTVKFILKCLGKQDNLAARILQIEATPQHSFYQQIMAVKEFLKWKSDIQVSTSEKRPGIPAVAMTSLNMQSRIGSIRTIRILYMGSSQEKFPKIAKEINYLRF